MTVLLQLSSSGEIQGAAFSSGYQCPRDPSAIAFPQDCKKLITNRDFFFFLRQMNKETTGVKKQEFKH